MTRPIAALLVLFFSLLMPVSAGGPSSIVDITRIHEIEITADKIIIAGDIICRTRLASETPESGSFAMRSTGITTAAKGARITIIPYFSRSDITGECMGNATRETMLKKYADLWAGNWKGNKETAGKLVKGGAASIGFQGEMITITGFEIKAITGWGTLVAKP